MMGYFLCAELALYLMWNDGIFCVPNWHCIWYEMELHLFVLETIVSSLFLMSYMNFVCVYVEGIEFD